MGRKSKSYESQKWEAYTGDRTYTRIFSSMFDSPADKHLTPQARSVYFTLKSQYKGEYTEKRFNTKGTVICPYSDIEESGIRRGSITRYLNELELFGFIRSESGGLSVASRYTFLEEWKNITNEEAVKLKQEAKNYKTRGDFDSRTSS